MPIPGEGYVALIAALGKIPRDILLTKMSYAAVESAKFRVIPFEFDDGDNPQIVTCVHPSWFDRFDEITGEAAEP
jgi:hypothetical protein